jgi:DNA-binding response OmpR family regulator
VPGYGRGRLPGQTIFLQRAFRPHPGSGAARPSAFGVRADRWRPQARSGAALVERTGRRIELTGKEFSLLEHLLLNMGRRVTRSMIIEHVWNLTFDTTTNVVDVYINYASAQVDQRKVGRLALAIRVAFQELGVFPASTTKIPSR